MIDDKDSKIEAQNRDFEAKTQEKGESGLALFVEIAKVVFWALVIIIPIRTFLFQPFFVQGASMEPNFHDGEYLIVNEVGYKQTDVSIGDHELFKVEPHKELKRGDVVVFRYPKNPSQYFIKRIIGLPGEKVVFKDGKVFIYNQENPNGAVLDESKYIPSVVPTNPMGDKSVFQLGNEEYFVMGDNRLHSSDSRSWGTLPEENVMGKVLLRAWPTSEFKVFN